VSEHEHVSLAARFLRSAARFPDRPALHVAGETVSYARLERRAHAIARRLTQVDPGDRQPELTAVFGSKTAATYAALLGIAFRGHGYVPLNPRYPPLRNAEILERSHCRALVVDAASLDAARAAVTSLREAPALVVPTGEEDSGEGDQAPSVDGNRPAYLLFTSGSTGRPKGVLVRQRNVLAFLDAVAGRYDLNHHDRLSQLFDLTFDLSAFDLFAAWDHGACVCSPEPRDLLRPVEFVRAAGLTVWFSVPSAAMLVARLGGLNAGMFPDLRLSLFCGEALTAPLADAWAAAAPNSIVENLYGPTEATIACTAHKWASGLVPGANGFVPIGEPIGATRVQVVDESLHEVPAGEPGQLLLSGPQVVDGYWEDSAATARAFVTIDADARAYLTGDRVVRPRSGAPLEFLGRIDSQIKVLGHRVELEEVEAVVREIADADALAVGWPQTPSGAAGIVVFVANVSLDRTELRRALSQRLPEYMVPRELRLVAELPLNANGKRDRRAALSTLEAE
jgi:amino acid adenylation domain-containing protein